MTMKKNLIRGMQAVGEMRAVIGEWSRKQFFYNQRAAHGASAPSQYNLDFRRNLKMSMKKNLIRGMQTIGQMRAVIGE